MVNSELLLNLYRAAREQPPGAFEEYAIGALKKLLGFDSAIWGTGLLRPNGSVAPHIVHLHEQPHEALREWAILNVADPVAAAIMKLPGIPIRFHAPTLFAGQDATPMRSYAMRYERQSYMVCGAKHPLQEDFMAWLSLYRRNPDDQFTEHEQALYRDAMSHLHEAQQINRRLHLLQSAPAADGEELPAIVDEWGYLHTPWSEIHALLEQEWPVVHPGRLPAPLLQALGSNGVYRGRTLTVRWRDVHGLFFLRVRRRTELGALSPREQEIAAAVSRGWSAKEAGKAMGLSPATVRAHLKNIYDKLGLHSQPELALLVGAEQGTMAQAATAAFPNGWQNNAKVRP